jgi:hypothetical protein
VILGEEIQKREVSVVVETEITEKDLKCMRLFVAIAVKDAKFLFNQQGTSPFIAVNVSPITAEQADPIVEEEEKDQDSKTKECLMQLVLLVEKDLSFLLGLLEKSLFIAMIVLIKEEVLQLKAVTRDIKNSLIF